jgi:hypothetical protein
VQQHVDILRWRMEELTAHFKVWLQEELVARKVWRVHPRDEFKKVIAKAEKVITKMQNLIIQKSRVLLEAQEPRRRSSVSWCDSVESKK